MIFSSGLPTKGEEVSDDVYAYRWIQEPESPNCRKKRISYLISPPTHFALLGLSNPFDLSLQHTD